MKPISRNGSARPRPSARNTSIASSAGAVNAYASAVPMNGAMHGLATTQASTPVKKSPSGPLRDASDWPMPPRLPPSVNTPDRLRPTANIRYASAATNHGCCSWKPQPAACPAARRPITSAPIAANDTSTPSEYQIAWLRAWLRLSPLWARPSTFSDRIGSTQGIRFSTSPPSRASTSIASRPLSVCGGWVRCGLSAEASAAGAAVAAGVGAGAGSAGSCPAGSGEIISGAACAWFCGDTVPAGSSSATRRVIGG